MILPGVIGNAALHHVSIPVTEVDHSRALIRT
jgi:hypothetical protein